MPLPHASPDAVPGHDAETIALVGFAHGVSHFFHLLLPPLFPWLMRDFGLSFTEIGATMTVFFVVSALGQAAAGFFVDRFGAVRVLAAGMACFAVAALVLWQADAYPQLAVAAAIAGLGNSVFHPADFTILNRQVTPARLGHAFSIHGLSGNLGWAAAPLLLTAIATAAGWRLAALSATAVALLALAVVLARRQTLGGRPLEAASKPPAGAPLSPFAFLAVPAVWMCFVFFFLVTTAFGAIQNFASPILQELHGVSLELAATALSAYLVGGAGGILLGGVLAARAGGLSSRLIALPLAAAALLALALAALPLPTAGVPLLMAAIGFLAGIAGPSRDLLVRQAATGRFGKSAYGRVYGFVYSGLDAGLAAAPLVFGGLMDHGRFAFVLAGVALLQALAILTALRVSDGVSAGVGAELSAPRDEKP